MSGSTSTIGRSTTATHSVNQTLICGAHLPLCLCLPSASPPVLQSASSQQRTLMASAPLRGIRMTASLCKLRRLRVLRAPPRRLSNGHAHRVVRSKHFLSTAMRSQEDQSHKLGTAPLSGMLVPVNNIMVVVGRVRAWLLQLLSFALLHLIRLAVLRLSPRLSPRFQRAVRAPEYPTTPTTPTSPSLSESEYLPTRGWQRMPAQVMRLRAVELVSTNSCLLPPDRLVAQLHTTAHSCAHSPRRLHL